jgi:prolipoprotein diacylglyceryltransferase
MAIFCAYYGVARFLSDFLRVNDETVLGLTGAQYLCLALLATSVWIWFRVRRHLAEDIAAGMPVGLAPATTAGDAPVEPDSADVDAS